MRREATQIFQDEPSLIGEGTFGKVFKVKQNQQFFAVKKIDKALVDKYGRHRQLVREIQIMKKIKHENIVRFYNFQEKNNSYQIKMEFCQGQNLRNFLLSNQYHELLTSAKSKSFGVRVALDMLYALAKIRNCMVSNRDIKPDNIIVNIDQNGKVKSKVVDFGEAKFHVKQSLSRVGTNRYMAPEIRDNQSYTQSCDLWSLGLTLYQIFQGVKPQLKSGKSFCCPFDEKFIHSPRNIHKFYDELIWRGEINLTKSRTPAPFRRIIKGLLKPEPQKRLTFFQAIDILKDMIEQIKECFQQEQRSQVEKKIIQALVMQKQTLQKKKLLENSIFSIQIISKKLLNPIISIFKQGQYSSNLQILKLIMYLVAKIEINLFQIVNLLEMDIQYALNEPLSQIFNQKQYEKLNDLSNKISNYCKVYRIPLHTSSRMLNQGVRNYISNKFSDKAAEMISSLEQIQNQ